LVAAVSASSNTASEEAKWVIRIEQKLCEECAISEPRKKMKRWERGAVGEGGCWRSDGTKKRGRVRETRKLTDLPFRPRAGENEDRMAIYDDTTGNRRLDRLQSAMCLSWQKCDSELTERQRDADDGGGDHSRSQHCEEM
jgi:hypothetical protein